jgi:hypothetical protein
VIDPPTPSLIVPKDESTTAPAPVLSAPLIDIDAVPLASKLAALSALMINALSLLPVTLTTAPVVPALDKVIDPVPPPYKVPLKLPVLENAKLTLPEPPLKFSILENEAPLIAPELAPETVTALAVAPFMMVSEPVPPMNA